MTYPGDVSTERLENDSPPPLVEWTTIGTVALPDVDEDNATPCESSEAKLLPVER